MTTTRHGLPADADLPARILTHRPGTTAEQYQGTPAAGGVWTMQTTTGAILRVSLTQDMPATATIELWQPTGWTELATYPAPLPVVPLPSDQLAAHALRRTLDHIAPLLDAIQQ